MKPLRFVVKIYYVGGDIDIRDPLRRPFKAVSGTGRRRVQVYFDRRNNERDVAAAVGGVALLRYVRHEGIGLCAHGMPAPEIVSGHMLPMDLRKAGWERGRHPVGSLIVQFRPLAERAVAAAATCPQGGAA